MLLAEIFSGNKINTYDSFLLKSAYEKTKDQIDRFKGGRPGVDTALESMNP